MDVTDLGGPWMKFPVVRFFALGAAIFVWTRTLGAPDPEPPFPPGTAVSDEEMLARIGLAQGLAREDAIVRQRLALNIRFVEGDRGRDEDALVDAAIDLGMDQTDLGVRKRLAHDVRNQLGYAAWTRVASEAELNAYYAAHRERFTEPPRARITQRFFRERAAAERALAALDDPKQLPGPLGEALPFRNDLPPLSEAELSAQLGAEIAAAAFTLAPEIWSGPLSSPYGFHLVRVHERTPARLSPFPVVRGAVQAALRSDQTAAAIRAGIVDLRKRYQLPEPGVSQ